MINLSCNLFLAVRILQVRPSGFLQDERSLIKFIKILLPNFPSPVRAEGSNVLAHCELEAFEPVGKTSFDEISKVTN